ncbi:MAG: putative sulfate/molybdate transporter [Syntrophales bacterium]|nr:putative sulfate/molybdate transporter [Syntrophales bacterium]
MNRSRHEEAIKGGIRFSAGEVSGAFGNFGTILPILFGAGITAGINVSHACIFMALWLIITGLYFRLPMPVEPMKAIGAVAIAGGLTAGEIAASGMIIGFLFLLLGLFRGMEGLKRIVPKPVIRGIQLGLALILVKKSLVFITADPVFAGISIGIILVFLVLSTRWAVPDLSSLLVVGIGIAAGMAMGGLHPFRPVSFPGLIIPASADWGFAALHLVLPQMPLTIGNAILATSLLTADLFQNREVSPDRLAKNTGLMNLVSAPFGGFPMCHGAGGLAAQHRFGARTGGANIIAGLILVALAFAFSQPESLTIIPLGIFGGLLVFVALELGRHGIKTESYPVTILMGVVALVTNITVAFAFGMAAVYILKRRGKKRGR